MKIYLLLSLVLVLSKESMAAPTVSYEYDELLLAFQWPTSYCNKPGIRCNHIPLEFTIHGLWPNPYSNRFFKCPKNSSIKNLYQKISSDLLKGLKIYWPNLNSLSNPGFLWDHEYEQHGYCFTRFPNPEVYFQTGLDIATNIIRNIMPTITMRLRSGPLYHVEDFRRVTIAGRELILGLRCYYARNSANAIPQLLEIMFCTDRNGNLKNCPYYVDKCNSQWRDHKGIDQSGWFQFPEPSGSSRSPPDWDPVPLRSAIAP